MKFEVLLNSMEDAAKLVSRLEYYDYQADAKIGSHTVDARSLMALISFAMGKVIQIFVYADADERLQDEIRELLVA